MAGKLISGINFEKLADYREVVDVKVAEGKIVSLPLISLRDAPRAEMFLKRADTLRADFAILSARLTSRVDATEEVKKAVEANPDVLGTLKNEEAYDRFDSTIDAIADSQKRMDGLIVKGNELADEMIAFLEPYLKDTGVAEQLRKVEAVHTTITLQAMLYGAAAFAESDTATKEAGKDSASNPTV